jgi:hypothetical protein
VRRIPLQKVTDKDAIPFLAQFYDWVRDSGVHIVATEQQVFNLTVGYAGTFDLLVEWPNGDLGVVDIKTGRGTYAEHALQLVSYALGEFVGADDVVFDDLTRALHKANTMALLHLSATGWEYQRVPADPAMYEAFRCLAGFAKWMAAYPVIDGLIDLRTAGSVGVP